MRPAKHCYVRPRYTAGSPGTFNVDFETPRKIAEQERRGYENALKGVYGKTMKHRAETSGLAGIVELRQEVITKKGWRVEDLVTGRKFFRKYNGAETPWQ